jgi:phenylalanine-4-hydroxylase
MLRISTNPRKLKYIYGTRLNLGHQRTGAIKILGAGLASSFAEASRVIHKIPTFLPFDPEIMGKTQELHHEFHDTLFVLESLDQLENFIRTFV